MVSSTLCPLGSQNVYGRAEGIADHYWPWAVFYMLHSDWSLTVYDVTSGDSFANVKRWLHEIDQNCDTVSRVLVGNKDDCPDRKVVLTQGEEKCA